ncbi:MAG: hypothetical protein AAB534_00565 [Patescibacteria group bacterium]|mgnify:CR=1 FL=1
MYLLHKEHYKIITGFFLLAIIFLLPQLLFAQSPRDTGLLPDCGANCDFNHLMELANNIMRFIIMVSIPLTAIIFSYAGFLYITAAGNESQIHHAHDIFIKVAIGFFFILAAWLIVYLITSTLLDPTYTTILQSR